MWVVSSRLDFSSSDEQLQAERQICEIVRESLSCRYKTFLPMFMIILWLLLWMTLPAGIPKVHRRKPCMNIWKKGQPVYLTLCCNLATTTDVRQTYLVIKKYLAAAQKYS